MKAAPLEDRTLVDTVGGTAIYVRNASDDWQGPFDAFTIPLGPGGSWTPLADEYLSFAGSHGVDTAPVEQSLSQARAVAPDKPVPIPLPSTGHDPRHAFLASAGWRSRRRRAGPRARTPRRRPPPSWRRCSRRCRTGSTR